MKALTKFTGCAVLMAAVLAASSLGCSKKADQSTPEATVKSFAEAMMDGDGDRAAACVSGSEQAKEFVRGMADFMGVMKDSSRPSRTSGAMRAGPTFPMVPVAA
ncbi:MAG: hypothetical protein ACP5HU_07575 [Phycisphaerae bacterium]